MDGDIAPRFVFTPDGRRVGYRRLGAGPPVALLHASPRSAAAVLPLALSLADRCTVFAFDTPGFGWSEALATPRPDAADLAHALFAAFDALGLDCLPIYGSHTGAAIATAAALLRPDRVAALALDGFSMFTPTEIADYLATYLPPFRPAWDGTHLAWLWSRVKDQFTVFPWYLRAEVARLPRPLAPLSLRQSVAVDFLAAGDAYRAAYAAAFRFGRDAIRRVAVPTVVMARSDDLLFGHLDALTDLPPCISVLRLGTDMAAWSAAVAAALVPWAAGEAPAVPPPGAQDVVRVQGGAIAVHRTRPSGTRPSGTRPSGTRPSGARPIVLLPPIPGSVAGEAALRRALARQTCVVAADLPGFGASALAQPSAAGIVEALATAIGEVPRAIVACGESAAIGAALAARTGGTLIAVDPVADAARAGLRQHMTDTAPREDGAHLLAAWHQLRDAGLWRPWHDRRPETAIDAGSDADIAGMQAVLTDWMRGGTAGRATLDVALAETCTAPIALRRDAADLIQAILHHAGPG